VRYNRLVKLRGSSWFLVTLMMWLLPVSKQIRKPWKVCSHPCVVKPVSSQKLTLGTVRFELICVPLSRVWKTTWMGGVYPHRVYAVCHGNRSTVVSQPKLSEHATWFYLHYSRAVESRFEGGSILEGDYAQLEFRVAGFLADDEGIKTDVDAGTDVHSYTASVIGCSRQDAKAHTFKPLYGGVSGTEDQKRYYNAFKEKYNNVTKWHEFLQKHAVTKKYIQLTFGQTVCFSTR
jgi:hypothetical protein